MKTTSLIAAITIDVWRCVKPALILFAILSGLILSCERKMESSPEPGSDSIAWSTGHSVFERECQRCHSFEGKGGDVGPSLDRFRQTMDATMARESIIEPQRNIVEGYRDLMPRDFGVRLTEAEIDAVVYYLTNRGRSADFAAQGNKRDYRMR